MALLLYESNAFECRTDKKKSGKPGSAGPWYLYKMVAQNMVLTYGVKQVFRIAEGIWLHRKSRQIRHFGRKRPILLYLCASWS